MANEPKRIEHIIKFIGDDLSDWESDFFFNISMCFEKKRLLTDLQYEKLEEVFERHQ